MMAAVSAGQPALENLIKQWQYRPHRLFRNRHLMTVAARFWPRQFLISQMTEEARYFDIESNVRVLAHCHWQPHRQSSPTLFLVHGLEGSSASNYMLGAADKAFQAGFNAVRYNLRNCGGTEHLTPTLYNSGQSNDVVKVLRQLIRQEGLREIYLAGYSLGGNLALKLAADMGETPLPELRGIMAISPSIDLAASVEAILRPANRVYHWRFLYSLKKRMQYKSSLFPQIYDSSHLSRIASLREFDDIYTAPHGGYQSAEEYYAKCSSKPRLGQIRIPTVIIHAVDDPFIPFSMFDSGPELGNPYLSLVATTHGGHVGFLSDASEDSDHFWIEHRLVDFIKYLH